MNNLTNHSIINANKQIYLRLLVFLKLELVCYRFSLLCVMQINGGKIL